MPVPKNTNDVGSGTTSKAMLPKPWCDTTFWPSLVLDQESTTVTTTAFAWAPEKSPMELPAEAVNGLASCGIVNVPSVV